MKEGEIMKIRFGFLAVGLSCALALGVSSLNAGQAQGATTKLRVGLGYIPDVQFAPFYSAVGQGFYAKNGLEVEFQHGFTSELYPLLASGKLDFVVGDAEDVILLRSKDAKATPFKYIMAMYQFSPNALFALKETNIKTLKDLKGKTIGIPGKFGPSWTSLQAALIGNKLKETDVKIQEIGFTQLEALVTKKVDVVMGFVNNEPVAAQARGIALNIFPLTRYNPSAGNGVITTDTVLKNEKLVRAFVGASQQGLKFTIDNQKQAFEAAKKYVPNMTEDRIKVLEASVPWYQSAFSKVSGLGFTNPNAWESSINLLKTLGRTEKPLDRSEFYTNKFLTSKVFAASSK
jgi:NitT/TauT family transport system substrate-binding protein